MICENIVDLVLTRYTVNSRCRFYIDDMSDIFIIFKCINVNKNIQISVLDKSKLYLKSPCEASDIQIEYFLKQEERTGFIVR